MWSLDMRAMLLVHRGISGMRVGCLYTHNTAATGALDNLGYFAMPSTLIQETAHQMLQDHDFVDSYIAENLRRLDTSYSALTGAHHVDHLQNFHRDEHLFLAKTLPLAARK